MRNIKEITRNPNPGLSPTQSRDSSQADSLAAELDANGIVVLPPLFSPEQLAGMQRAFESCLRRMRWNNFEGYQQTELYRQMVEDVLLLDQGFVDLALHPLVKQILSRYLGTKYELTEARGWRSLPTSYDFHGWHADAWYDQTTEKEIHREIKLAMYLTDVHTGAFHFIKGSHRQQHPHSLKKGEVMDLPFSELIKLTGPAGTTFLFDTSAIHRQGIPMLEPRQAVFYAYHDPTIPLQAEDVDYYRYHPLLLNAGFLGDLSDEDRRILGFGNKTNFQPAFERAGRPPFLFHAFNASVKTQIRMRHLGERLSAGLRRVLRIS
jgi:hypothetical protein